VRPGAIELTRTPFWPNSFAKHRITASVPDFVPDVRGVMPQDSLVVEAEDIVITAPARLSHPSDEGLEEKNGPLNCNAADPVQISFRRV
jgi:hypothetical protein